MSEGEDDKPVDPGTMPPPSRAEHAARKLGMRGTSGSFAKQTGSTSARTPALESQGTRPSEEPVASKDDAKARADAIFAARRGLVTGGEAPPAPQPTTPKKAPTKKGPSWIVIAGVILLILGGGAYGAMTLVRVRYESSDEGQVHERLVDSEFALRDNVAREAAWAAIDKLPKGPATAVTFLGDATTASRGSSHSTRKMQELANQYLMHYASTVKAEPPSIAKDIVAATREGRAPTADQWTAAQQAWRAFVDAHPH